MRPSSMLYMDIAVCTDAKRTGQNPGLYAMRCCIMKSAMKAREHAATAVWCEPAF